MNGFIGVDNPDLSQNEISITLLSDVGGHLGCVRENLKSTVLLKKALDEATTYDRRLNGKVLSTKGTL